MESLILSPTFTIILGVVGLYLFVILAREFFVWFLKLGKLSDKLSELDRKVTALTETLEKIEKQEPVILPPLPHHLGDSHKEQFPLVN